jgi:hypothetical protein
MNPGLTRPNLTLKNSVESARNSDITVVSMIKISFSYVREDVDRTVHRAKRQSGRCDVFGLCVPFE